MFFIFLILGTCACLAGRQATAWATDKSWNAAGDQSNWFDDANWLPGEAPTSSDNAMINTQNASATIPQTFDVKSMTLGGKRASTVTVNNFIDGAVRPASPTDLAIYNRRDGHLILNGSVGKITLKGSYKDSEEVLPEEPSFMFYVQ